MYSSLIFTLFILVTLFILFILFIYSLRKWGSQAARPAGQASRAASEVVFVPDQFGPQNAWKGNVFKCFWSFSVPRLAGRPAWPAGPSRPQNALFLLIPITLFSLVLYLFYLFCLLSNVPARWCAAPDAVLFHLIHLFNSLYLFSF